MISTIEMKYISKLIVITHSLDENMKSIKYDLSESENDVYDIERIEYPRIIQQMKPDHLPEFKMRKDAVSQKNIV